MRDRARKYSEAILFSSFGLFARPESEPVLGRGAGGTEGRSALWPEPQPGTERVQRRPLGSSLPSSELQ